MKRIRRPGYLSGYQHFGQTKGGTDPVPQPPLPTVTQLTPPAAPAPSQPRVATPTAPVRPVEPAPTASPAAARPMAITPAQRADPAFMARISALQRQVSAGPRAPMARPGTQAVSRPAARPTLPQAEDDDED